MKRFLFWNLIDVVILSGLMIGTHLINVVYDVTYVFIIFLLFTTGYVHVKQITLFHLEKISKQEFRLAYGSIPDFNFFLKGMFIFFSCGYLLYNESKIVALIYMSLFMMHHIIKNEV